MARNNQLSIADTFRTAFASIIFAGSAQIAIAVFGLVVVIALRQGRPNDSDLWRVVLLSCIPWGMIAFQTVISATRGVGGLFAQPAPNPSAMQVKQDLRMIPVYRAQTPAFAGVDVEDLEFFIERICITRDWTKRAWLHVRMPSGAGCDYDYHRKMVTILKQAGFIINHQPRSSGKLVTRNPDQIINHLQLNTL